MYLETIIIKFNKMQIELITKKQVKEEVKKEVDKREFKMQQLINLLHRKVNRLEEEVKIRIR